MSGASVLKLQPTQDMMQTLTITPELATELLERNGLNRPLNEQHVSRIARQIKTGKWRFNGDTIKIADTNDVLDGDHRLWAVIEAKMPIETILVRGIAREAFATIDTLRKPRSGGDVLALNGAHRYRTVMATALAWLIRWQRGTLIDYRAPKNKIENSDIEDMYAVHGGIAMAAERVMPLKRICNTSLMTFFYYVLVNRNSEIAERMIRTLEYPSAVNINDPFFCLRNYFLTDRVGTKSPIVTIAYMIKAANAAYKGKTIQTLNWRNQGERPEPFPVLKVEG